MTPSAAKRLLVVDDDPEVVEMIRIILSTKGYRCDVAYDGQEGLERLIAEGPYDLVLVDLRMPRMSGMEFCRRVRGDEALAATPLLVVSSMGSEIDKPDAFWRAGLGSDDFLAKPFDPLSLLGKVEYLLRKNAYVSHGGPSGSGPAIASANPGGEASFDPDDPAAVVRAYVECWNRGDFACEVQTLTDEMMGGLTTEEYQRRRAQLWNEEGGASTQHQALDVTVVKAEGNVATVACLREDTARGRTEARDERYTLRRTAAGWKIANVRSRIV